MRTPSLSRNVAMLLALALGLLLFVNVVTFVMIQRTAAYNETVEEIQQTRRAARTLYISVLDAETGQRGFVLTGQREFLRPYEVAAGQKGERIASLKRRAEGQAGFMPHVERLEQAVEAKVQELDRTIALVQAGRIGEAMQLVRAGEGRRQMEIIRAQVAAIDELAQTRLTVATQRSEAAGRLTLAVNAIAAVLILILGAMAAWMIRRYLAELTAAREEIDRVNAGLEDKVQARTLALSRANEEIQRFAYIVSHDLRAPLVNVMGYTSELEQAGLTLERQLATLESRAPELLDKEAALAVREDVPEAVGFIRASTGKMDRLINAILKLSREGRRPLTPERLDMVALIQGIADSVRHQTDAANAEVVVGDLPWIDSDRLSVEQVFGNLIDNAVKYLDPDRAGVIRVEGEDRADGWVEYRVIDNGRGVAERDFERIFELFRRSGRQDRPGEGLGLAFVRNSVRRLGGEIDLDSQLGKGSTFRLKFPKRLKLAEAGDAA